MKIKITLIVKGGKSFPSSVKNWVCLPVAPGNGFPLVLG
ncbi:hypothetical protein SAMN00790413_05846 [Deinococcus hopiensis KR-140]|uniref:Uncharacterized protein n=1 Tax=Deinococcus hopiensis KR-140 TaxID=695939 RepID=A0A1W1UDQ2_9DEIO|nr:hypothetical protein SAMN00790413_05846 [Deinococcus hopiensis KR-140]